MSYVKITNFAIKDSTNDIIRGTEHDDEYNAIEASFTAQPSATQTLTNKTIALGSNTVSGTTAQFNTALTDGDFATLAGTETLTNKALNGSLGATTPSTVVATSITGTDLTTTGNTILGNASTDTLNVGNGDLIKDASGNVGIGITPSAWSSSYKALQVGAGSVPFLMGPTGSSGSSLYLGANAYDNGTNWIYINNQTAAQYVQQTGQHIWRTAPSGTAGNPITFTQAMTLDASGNLYIGTTSAIAGSTGPLQVYSGGTDGIVVQQIGSALNDCIGMWHSATSGNNTFVAFFTETSITGRGSITYNRGAGLTAYNTTSDYRLKENIVDLPDALESVLMLKPRKFSWKETGNVTTGFIAHELAEVCPHAVSGEKDATREEQYEISPAIPAVLDEEGNEVTPAVEAVMGTRTVPVYQGIDTSFLVATLTAAIQELKAELDITKAKVAALEAA